MYLRSAWNSKSTLSAEQARQQYVELVAQYFAQWQPDCANDSQQGAPAGPVFSSLANSKECEDELDTAVVCAAHQLSLQPLCFPSFLACHHSVSQDRQACVYGLQPVGSLHIKASMDDVPGVEQMLKTGAQVNQRDDQGCTPLHWAADRGSQQVTVCCIM